MSDAQRPASDTRQDPRAETIARLRRSGALLPESIAYEAIAPDGTRILKRTFKCRTPTAFMDLYRRASGTWIGNGVRPTKAEITWASDDVIVPCRRLDPHV